LQHGERHIVGTTIYPAKEERPVSVLEKTVRPSAVTGIEQCEAMPLRPIGAIIDEAA
jgi:hypothetical protein